MQFAIDADDEKGGAHTQLTQGIEDLGGVARIGTVVEGQCDFSILATLPGDHIRRGKCRKAFGRDQMAFRIEFDGTLAGMRLSRDAQDFAAPFVIQSIGEVHLFQSGGPPRVQGSCLPNTCHSDGSSHPDARGRRRRAGSSG